MSSQTVSTEVPDTVVQAIRAASVHFLRLQAARYGTAGSSSDNKDPVLASDDDSARGYLSLIMKTKTALPTLRESAVLDAWHTLPSVWSEYYRGTVSALLADGDAATCLWGLVSAVLCLMEQGGGVDGVNASVSVVEWHDRFHNELQDVEEVMAEVRRADPRALSDDAIEELGSDMLGRIESAFLSGHFEAAAALMDAFLVFLRRGGSLLLSAEVESALADVKRLLCTGFHDPETHRHDWVEAANEQLQESRNILVNPSGSSSSNSYRPRGIADVLVEDLCATCRDVLSLITRDATQLVRRCREGKKSAVDFLVAVCAIMEPYADLPRVSTIFEEYAGEWQDEADAAMQWYYECVQHVLGVDSLHAMVRAMERVAQITTESFAWTGEEDGETTSAADEEGDEAMDDMASDTVSLDEVEAANAASTVGLQSARRFTLASMTAHIADLCAPPVVAVSAADIALTFARNSLISAYAELFAFHPRTWRIAGLYATYSPLLNPCFLAGLIERVAPLAAAEPSSFRDVRAFLETSWSPQSTRQRAVRAAVDALLPNHPTVSKWYAVNAYHYAEASETFHLYIIVEAWNRGQWPHAAWLAVETGLTDVLQSHLRQLLQSADALVSAELYAVGAAVHHGFIALDACAAVELARYLCAAAALAAYREAATAASAAWTALTSSPATSPTAAQATGGSVLSSSAGLPSRGSAGHPSAPPTAVAVADVVATCLEAVEAALKSSGACDVMLHPSNTFTLVEHGARLLQMLRELMGDPVTGESANSAHVSSALLPLFVEAYQLSSVHFAFADAALEKRGRVLAEQLARVHQTCMSALSS